LWLSRLRRTIRSFRNWARTSRFLLPIFLLLTGFYFYIFWSGQKEAVVWYDNVRNGIDRGSQILLIFHYFLLFDVAATWIAYLLGRRGTTLVIMLLPVLFALIGIVALLLR